MPTKVSFLVPFPLCISRLLEKSYLIIPVSFVVLLGIEAKVLCP